MSESKVFKPHPLYRYLKFRILGASTLLLFLTFYAPLILEGSLYTNELFFFGGVCWTISLFILIFIIHITSSIKKRSITINEMLIDENGFPLKKRMLALTSIKSVDILNYDKDKPDLATLSTPHIRWPNPIVFQEYFRLESLAKRQYIIITDIQNRKYKINLFGFEDKDVEQIYLLLKENNQ